MMQYAKAFEAGALPKTKKGFLTGVVFYLFVLLIEIMSVQIKHSVEDTTAGLPIYAATLKLREEAVKQ